MKMDLFKKLRSQLRDRRRYERRLARLEQCGNFHVTEIDGVRVAQGNGLNLGYVFDGDGILIVEEIFNRCSLYIYDLTYLCERRYVPFWTM